MKTKTFKLIVLFALSTILSLSVFADEFNPLIYQYTNPEVTIVFSSALDISEERQQEIAEEIAGISSLTNPGIASPDNIICTIFGHNLSTSTVTAIHHKVKQYTPRCLMKLYEVTACSRCDYTQAELIDSFYITCCPED
jgi:energy-converting hydrogenase A subunit M